MQMKANCHLLSRPVRNYHRAKLEKTVPVYAVRLPYNIPIHNAQAYPKQLSRIGLLPNDSLSLNKHNDNIVSQAVVCYWAAR